MHQALKSNLSIVKHSYAMQVSFFQTEEGRQGKKDIGFIRCSWNQEEECKPWVIKVAGRNCQN